MNALETSLTVLGALAFVVAGLFLLGAFINPKALDLDGRGVVGTGGPSGTGVACAQVRRSCLPKTQGGGGGGGMGASCQAAAFWHSA